MGVLTAARAGTGPARLVGLLLAAALSGCTHLSTAEGAIPLAPGTADFAAQLQVSRAPNPLSTPTALPLPGVALHIRRGLTPDVDVGVHVYTLGVGADVRYRFAELGGWHMAVAPGFAGIAAPVPSLQFAHLDLSLPVRAERPIGRGWSVAGGPALLARQTFLALQSDAVDSSSATFELYAGGGLRLQRLGRRLKLGISADVYLDTTRATGLFGGLGFDLGTAPRPVRGRSRPG